MFRSRPFLSGFDVGVAPVASARLINAVVFSLVLGAFALCLCVGLTLATSVTTFALPLGH